LYFLRDGRACVPHQTGALVAMKAKILDAVHDADRDVAITSLMARVAEIESGEREALQ
jgi:hypothetical protein